MKRKGTGKGVMAIGSLRKDGITTYMKQGAADHPVGQFHGAAQQYAVSVYPASEDASLRGTMADAEVL
jgi:hypothetical protein